MIPENRLVTEPQVVPHNQRGSTLQLRGRHDSKIEAHPPLTSEGCQTLIDLRLELGSATLGVSTSQQQEVEIVVWPFASIANLDSSLTSSISTKQ